MDYEQCRVKAFSPNVKNCITPVFTQAPRHQDFDLI